MKIRRYPAAAAVSALLLLTGCNRYGTNLPEEYKDFLDYTFNGNYTVELTEKAVINEGYENEQGYRYWDVTYTDKRGMEHTDRLTGAQLFDADKEYYKTQEWFDVFEMHAFTTVQMGNIARQELWDEILSDDLDVEYAWDETIHKGEECTLLMLAYGVSYSFDETGYAYAKQKLSPENGWCISECDLTSVLQDDEFMLMLVVRLEPDADAALYQEKITKIEEELLSYTGGVQNYTIVLKQNEGEDTDASTTLYEHTVFLGEDFVPDPAIENDSLAKAVLRNWEEKYK